jgi:RNA polymerase sigma-70 factor, ECF subfamily
MLAALEGDKASYHLLLTHISPWLAAYFRKRVPAHQVEDFVQDTLMSVHAKRHTFNPAFAFPYWLSAIARHKLIDYWRAQGSHTTIELPEDIAANDTPNQDAAYDVQKLLSGLPAGQAAVIRLLKLEERSIADVAATTGHSQETVKVMMHRGLKKMMAMVGGRT